MTQDQNPSASLPITGQLTAALLTVGLFIAQLCVAPSLEAQQAAREADLLIVGGRVLDGSGNPWFAGDIAVSGGRIVAVSAAGAPGHIVWTARDTLNATGLLVTPGFIDTHSHAGPSLTTPELSHARPILAQGVTTVFVNPDGSGALDLARQRSELEADGLGVNVAQFVAHGTVREAVLGMEARLATDDELQRMTALVRAGMLEGAWGMSSGPFYAPGSYSDTAELVELARVVATYGGAYQSHIRDESTYSIGVEAAVDEVITVAREAGLPGVWTHAKALGPDVWGYGRALRKRIERARAAGTEVYADQYPYLASATGLDAALLPRWAQAGGRDSLLSRLARTEDRARIRADMAINLGRRGGAERIQFRYFAPDRSIEGRTLAEIARAHGRDPLDAAMALMEQGSAAIVSFNMDEEDLRDLMAQPWTMTASDGALPEWQDGVPHPRAYGAFTRKLETYVADEGVVSLEHAIRSMTSLPARVYRMTDRGEIRPGLAADLAIFDLSELTTRSTFTDPHHLAEGMRHVLVNGEFAIRNGQFIDARAGQVLRKR
jgi:N-acyl-D-aspartate/D-glutamate deacylase